MHERRRDQYRGPAILIATIWIAAMTPGRTSDDGTTPTGGGQVRRNRLAGSTSPYLLQHQDNPVSWYPWGTEAIEKARREDKPIFLSIGYSACHWCHVMEEESFEDPATAELMDRYFVSIKVDREERPDLDDIYMTAVQMITGSGGWPMSVWLTPDLKPFYGGTYFPKEPHYGRPSFRQVLEAMGERWKTDRASMVAQAEKVHEAVSRYLSGRGAETAEAEPRADAEKAPPGEDPIARAVADLTNAFDHVHGGFGTAPKFPPHRALTLMLSRYRRTRDENLIRMATLTFDRMARGGMYDQIGGGFHRYSTDARWLVPHFEKMLYDNALLADAYIDAWQTTGADPYRIVAREIFEWTLREMTDPQGPFYSTLDADSEGEEGRYYVWKPEQVVAVLGPSEGALVNEFYGITPAGNFDGGTSIPHIDIPQADFAERRRIPQADLARRLDAARGRLLAARTGRPRPHLDDKLLTAWNGMMISALARGGRVFDEPRYLDAARKAARFLLANARSPEGLLRVSYRQGKVNPESFVDDQAFFVEGLLALHVATGESEWLAQARAIVKAADAVFLDPVAGGYFFAPAGRSDLIVRAKGSTDGAIPSGNSVMARALLTLHALTGEDEYRRRAGEILTTFRPGMEAMPGAFHNMLAALESWLEAGAAPASPPATREPVVIARAASFEAPSKAGGAARLELRLQIAPGWHINSSKPTLSYLIPTRVGIRSGGVTLENAAYPEGRMHALGFAGKPISVYEGRQTIPLTIRLDAGTAPWPASIEGYVTYQACNDTACLLPAQASFAVEVPATPPASGR